MKRQKGFNLLEILISTIILSVGLLGLTGLQIRSITYNADSQIRSVAISQISDIVDRMISNKVGIASNQYDNLSGIPSNPPSCSTCNASEIAQIDLFDWNTKNAEVLPSGRGTIVGANNVFTIRVMWDQAKSGVTGTSCSGDSTIDLTCMILTLTLQ